MHSRVQTITIAAMYISLDLETTGFDSEKDQIIEFGAIKFDLKGNQETLSFLCKPNQEIPEIVSHITGIYDEDVADKKPFAHHIKEVEAFIKDFPIIGHNIQFDTGFLKANGVKISSLEWDTHPLSKMMLPEADSHSLEVLSSLLGLTHQNKHRALDDAIAAMKLFEVILAKLSDLPEDLREEINKVCKKTEWPLKSIFLNPPIIEKEISYKDILATVSQTNSENTSEEIIKFLSNQENSLLEASIETNQIENILNSLNRDDYLAVTKKNFDHLAKKINHNFAQLDLAKNYFSPNRFSDLLNEDSFEDHIASAIIKTIIWQKQTQTGLLSELSFFQKEREILEEICINENIYNLEQETYFQQSIKKDENSAAICTHQFLSSLKDHPNKEKLIILDFEQYSKTLQYQESIYLNIELFTSPLLPILKENQDSSEIEKIFSSSTILFGLIGILFENHNDQNKYKATCKLSPELTDSKEWTDIKKSITSLIENSNSLAKFQDKESYLGCLKGWKENLKKIHKIFFQTPFNAEITLIELTQNQKPVLRSIPKNINEQIKQTSKKFQNYIYINPIIDLQDDATFFKTHYELDPNLTFHKIKKDFAHIKVNIHQSAPSFDSEIIDYIFEIPEIKEGNSILICNSLKNVKESTLKAKYTFPDLEICSTLTGSLGKASSKFLENPQKSLLILTTNNWLKLKSEESLQHLQNIFIQKIPFSPPSDPYLTAKTQRYSNPFIEYQIPESIITLKKMIYKFQKISHKVNIQILDNRLLKKKYGSNITKNLKEDFLVNII